MLRGSTELFEGQRKGRAKTWALGRATLAPARGARGSWVGIQWRADDNYALKFWVPVVDLLLNFDNFW